MEDLSTKSEREILRELEQLARSPGFVHVIAYLSLRDNFISYSPDELLAKDLSHLYGNERLVRTELSLLIGFMIKGDLDLSPLSVDEMESRIEATEESLKDLQNVLALGGLSRFEEDSTMEAKGEHLREPIFYGGESAYIFQFRDFSEPKYSRDSSWMEEHLGFHIEEAVEVAKCLQKIQNDNINEILGELRRGQVKESSFSVLPALCFTLAAIENECSIPAKNIEAVVRTFSVDRTSDQVANFSEVGDFNAIDGYPIIELDNGKFLLLQIYGLMQALYETPFYLMLDDSDYINIATTNRGKFTEEFSALRLIEVFGQDRVHKNVLIRGERGNIAGEIDVLVTYADRVIIVQAKSKRLTIASRKGSDNMLRHDFGQGIGAAYKQAFDCGQFLIEGNHKLEREDGKAISLSAKPKQVFLFCVLADHYPALSLQAREYLELRASPTLARPFVMDLFLLDSMAEMLASPLHFLSYCDRRSTYYDQILASHEITVLSYHLKQNLFIQDDALVWLDDDVTTDLDVAVYARREGLPGVMTPAGILTVLNDTTLGSIFLQLEEQEHAGTLELAFLLLYLSQETVETVSKAIDAICSASAEDGITHDATFAFANKGLTIHSSYSSSSEVIAKLEAHCLARKYTTKADQWFGILLHPDRPTVALALGLNFNWESSPEFDEATKGMSPGSKHIDFASIKRPKKIGRNKPCPCGSGVKYKKCCGRN